MENSVINFLRIAMSNDDILSKPGPQRELSKIRHLFRFIL